MTKTLLLAALATATLAQPALAQSAAATEDAVSETDAALPATVLDQWLEDPAQVFDATTSVPEDFLWRARPLVVFADSPFDPNFQEQMDLLTSRIDELVERDVVILVDTDPANPSALRTRLRPRGFMLALIGKDGGVKLRKPLPWDVRELSRSIDKMPIRQQEIRDRRGSDG